MSQYHREHPDEPIRHDFLQGASGVRSLTDPLVKRPWPDPTPEMLATPEFNAVWQCIKRWDINVPDVYGGYCGATGNHVRAILDALAAIKP